MPHRGAEKEPLSRFYSVSEPRLHERGHTEYKVTARIVSRKHPEKISETVVWRRYSDFKKLHRDLAYIHRNLFRRSEEFPAFAKPTIFGRFEAAVLEERRASAEMLLRFAATVPALYNSQQLKDFLEGGHSYELGESASLPSLPEPLLPLPGIDSLPSTPPLPANTTVPPVLQPSHSASSAVSQPQVADEDLDLLDGLTSRLSVSGVEDCVISTDLCLDEAGPTYDTAPVMTTLDMKIEAPGEGQGLHEEEKMEDAQGQYKGGRGMDERESENESENKSEKIEDVGARDPSLASIPVAGLSQHELELFDPCAKSGEEDGDWFAELLEDDVLHGV